MAGQLPSTDRDWSVADAERMAAAGFDAVLVGEMLVQAPDATTAVRGLAAVTRRGR